MLKSDLAVHRLCRRIAPLDAHPELCARNPGRDFVRHRKIPLGTLLTLLVARNGHSVETELLDMLGWDGGFPTVSAYSQQRRKLAEGALRTLNSGFLREWDVVPYLGEYRLMVADGTGIPLPGPGDESCRIKNGVGEFWHGECHPTLAYDPLRDTFEDMVMQGARKSYEPAALCEIVDRLYPGRAPDGTPLRPLWLADRNYGTHNVYCHMAEPGASYCIRASDSRAEALVGPDVPAGEFDVTVDLILTRTRSASRRSRPDEPWRYRVVRPPTPLDVVAPGSRGEYPITLRVVRVALPADDGDPNEAGDEWLNLVTDLPADRFGPDDLRDLYRTRWREELGIRDLKHTVGMRDPGTRDPQLAAHEFWGSVVLYNACSLGSGDVPEPEAGPKWPRASDKAAAFRGMHRKIRGVEVRLEEVCSRLSHSVRKGRRSPIRKRPQRPPSLTYRG